MKGILALLAFAGAAIASPVPQGVTASLSPGPAPSGCMTSVSGTFQISTVNVTTSKKRSQEKRQSDGTLMLSLQSGTLKDSSGRTGYIAANRQFQFDNPPQTGAIYTTGWSVCSNGSLAIGSNAVFYQCLSGNFYNLYDESQGNQCTPIYIVRQGGSSSASATPSAASSASAAPKPSQISDGQVQASTAVSQISDGQIQATTAGPYPSMMPTVSQISDGQIQETTGMVSQISDGQIQAPTMMITQISDGQIQAPTGMPVSQISDGQVQATTAAPMMPPVSQISDGQIQETTAAPYPSMMPPVSQISDGQVQQTTATMPAVSQISDGQVQQTTATMPAVSQISDGQVQQTTAAMATVSQISDGQIQATTAAPPVSQITDGQIQAPTSTAIATFTGAANRELAGGFALMAGLVGAVVML